MPRRGKGAASALTPDRPLVCIIIREFGRRVIKDRLGQRASAPSKAVMVSGK